MDEAIQHQLRSGLPGRGAPKGRLESLAADYEKAKGQLAKRVEDEANVRKSTTAIAHPQDLHQTRQRRAEQLAGFANHEPRQGGQPQLLGQTLGPIGRIWRTGCDQRTPRSPPLHGSTRWRNMLWLLLGGQG